jgi:hypothetical protein
MNAAPRPAQLTVDELPEPADFILGRNLAAYKFLRESHGAKRQADGFVHPLVL